MLVLTVSNEEFVKITTPAGDIFITARKSAWGKIRLGFVAPREIVIEREARQDKKHAPVPSKPSVPPVAGTMTKGG